MSLSYPTYAKSGIPRLGGLLPPGALIGK